MTIIFSIAIISFVSIFHDDALACDINGNTGFVEENSLWIPDLPGIIPGNVTKEEFHQVLDKIEAIYKPAIRALGKTFLIHRDWDSGLVNAYATQRKNNWLIIMYGGLARHKEITLDGFTLAACHEVGHHVGGAPHDQGFKTQEQEFANEGQSDYFSTAKCFRKVVEQDDNMAMMSQVHVPKYVVRKCEDNFLTPEDIAVCTRSAMGTLSIGRLIWDIGKKRIPEIHFQTPDPTVVRVTYDQYPNAQCRLDTFFAGSLCDKSPYLDMDKSDPNINACTRAENYIDGIRPLCWFRPPASTR